MRADTAIRWCGNTGKARIQHDLLALDRPVSIIDVGVVGTGPLDLWRMLPLERMPFTVVGVDDDAAGVAQARRLGLAIELHAISGYVLSEHFPAGAFDIAICTQVLEHVAEPVRLLSQIRKVLAPGGQLWLTVDSAHFASSHHGDPLWKRAARPLAARFSERYYDFGLTEEDLRRCLSESGFITQEVWHCNLDPLKPLYASLSEQDARAFTPAWLAFEESLAAGGFARKELFRAMYASATATTIDPEVT